MKKNENNPVKVKKPKKGETQEEAMRGGRPFPVPPGGCPDGWRDNGGGNCVLDT